MNYDAEMPRGFQDADIEMRELTAAANRDARLRKLGRCTHTWYGGPPGPASAPRTDWRCHHCGKVFASERALMWDAATNRGDE
jgi:hypothetical protein